MNNSYRGHKRSKRKSSRTIRRNKQAKTTVRLANVTYGHCPEQGREMREPCNLPIWQLGRSDAAGYFCRIHALCYASLGGHRCDNLRAPTMVGFSRYCVDHSNYIRDCQQLDANRQTACHDIRADTKCTPNDTFEVCRKRRVRINDCLQTSERYYNTCLHKDVQNEGHTKFLYADHPNSWISRIERCDAICPPRTYMQIEPEVDEEGFTTVRRRR